MSKIWSYFTPIPFLKSLKFINIGFERSGHTHFSKKLSMMYCDMLFYVVLKFYAVNKGLGAIFE